MLILSSNPPNMRRLLPNVLLKQERIAIDVNARRLPRTRLGSGSGTLFSTFCKSRAGDNCSELVNGSSDGSKDSAMQKSEDIIVSVERPINIVY